VGEALERKLGELLGGKDTFVLRNNPGCAEQNKSTTTEA